MSILKKFNVAFLAKFQSFHASIRDVIFTTLASFCAIYTLTTIVHSLSVDGQLSLLVLASMGASTFLLFVIPHSPMSQPWPVIAGHFVSSVIGVSCAHYLHNPAIALAAAVSLSILAMHALQCLHPPGAATAMIAVLGGPVIQSMGWQFCYEVVAINACALVLLSILINDLILKRRYPLQHSHHPHHEGFIKDVHTDYLVLSEVNFKYALERIDGEVDISVEELIDLYEFALEDAKGKK